MDRLARSAAAGVYTIHVARDPNKASAGVQKAAAKAAKKADQETETIKARRRQGA